MNTTNNQLQSNLLLPLLFFSSPLATEPIYAAHLSVLLYLLDTALTEDGPLTEKLSGTPGDVLTTYSELNAMVGITPEGASRHQVNRATKPILNGLQELGFITYETRANLGTIIHIINFKETYMPDPDKRAFVQFPRGLSSHVWYKDTRAVRLFVELLGHVSTYSHEDSRVGYLAPGDALFAVKSYAERLQMKQNRVKQLIGVLEESGAIKVRRGGMVVGRKGSAAAPTVIHIPGAVYRPDKRFARTPIHETRLVPEGQNHASYDDDHATRLYYIRKRTEEKVWKTRFIAAWGADELSDATVPVTTLTDNDVITESAECGDATPNCTESEGATYVFVTPLAMAYTTHQETENIRTGNKHMNLTDEELMLVYYEQEKAEEEDAWNTAHDTHCYSGVYYDQSDDSYDFFDC